MRRTASFELSKRDTTRPKLGLLVHLRRFSPRLGKRMTVEATATMLPVTLRGDTRVPAPCPALLREHPDQAGVNSRSIGSRVARCGAMGLVVELPSSRR